MGWNWINLNLDVTGHVFETQKGLSTCFKQVFFFSERENYPFSVSEDGITPQKKHCSIHTSIVMDLILLFYLSFTALFWGIKWKQQYYSHCQHSFLHFNNICKWHKWKINTEKREVTFPEVVNFKYNEKMWHYVVWEHNLIYEFCAYILIFIWQYCLIERYKDDKVEKKCNEWHMHRYVHSQTLLNS